MTPEKGDSTTEAPQTGVQDSTNEETGIEATVPVLDTGSPDGESNDFPWWIVIGAAVIVLAVAVLIVIKKKK